MVRHGQLQPTQDRSAMIRTDERADAALAREPLPPSQQTQTPAAILDGPSRHSAQQAHYSHVQGVSSFRVYALKVIEARGQPCGVISRE